MKKGLWIICYGNPDRRDDGCAWHVAARLRSSLEETDTIVVRTLHQLDPALAEELGCAEKVVFVDAAVQDASGGPGWRRIVPETRILPLMTHHLKPSFLMGLVSVLWGTCPEAWLITIQGQDFGLGEGLNPETEEKVEKVAGEIASFAGVKIIDKSRESSNYKWKQEGGCHGHWYRYPDDRR